MSSGMVMGRIFSARKNRKFFRPGPNSARPDKCSGLVSLIQRSKNPNITQIGSRLSGQRTLILFQRSQVQIPEWELFLQFRFIYRICCVTLIKRSKTPNITQIDSCLIRQHTSILFERSQVQIPEWACTFNVAHVSHTVKMEPDMLFMTIPKTYM
jgi:hypothetical protein